MQANPQDKPRRSGLGIVSAILGLAALALAVAVLLVLDEKIMESVPLLCFFGMIAVVATGFGWLCIPYIFLSGTLAVVSVICSIVALRRISKSAGKLAGTHSAWIGMSASGLAGLILQHTGLPHF